MATLAPSVSGSVAGAVGGKAALARVLAQFQSWAARALMCFCSLESETVPKQSLSNQLPTGRGKTLNSVGDKGPKPIAVPPVKLSLYKYSSTGCRTGSQILPSWGVCFPFAQRTLKMRSIPLFPKCFPLMTFSPFLQKWPGAGTAPSHRSPPR